MSDQFDMSELLEVFFEEADEQLQKLDDGFLALEKNPEDIQLIKEIFRAAHTLKGSSATMGFEQIASLTHTMENLLDKLRAGQQPVTAATVDALLKSVDVLRSLLEKTRTGSDVEIPVDEAIEAIQAVSTLEACDKSDVKPESTVSSKSGPADGCTRIDVRIATDSAMPSIRGFMVLNALTDKGEIVSVNPAQDKLEELQSGGTITIDIKPSVPVDQIKSALDCICEIEAFIVESSPSDAKTESERRSVPDRRGTAVKAEAESQTRAMQTVRVGVDRLDSLMNLVGELVIDRTRIGQIESELSASYTGDPAIGNLGEASLHLGRAINEMQEQIMKIRMLPVDQVFNRFPRMVRDLAQKAGKKVNFVISGQDTELDRSILEDIVDPITHLLRNAIDHGIETPEERLKAGKPEIATVRLSAGNEENRIVISVEDDGHGIAVDKVKKSSVEKGFITQDQADRMTEKDALMLIFGAGVSTAKAITDVSGRGVGMDVVKSNIEKLSGSVDIHTALGEGTRIELQLPLTLAIVQALITSVENRMFAIPLTAVVETSRCYKKDISTMEGRPVLQFRGSVLPLVYLGEVFPSRNQAKMQIEDEMIMVVVRTAGQQVGITVDALIGEHEVVIKSLGAYLGQVKGVSGAALLGDGKIALIVDASSLAKMLERKPESLAA